MASKNRISKTCPMCGTDFDVKTSFSNRTYCSQACSADAQRKEKTLKHCKNCSDEFEVHDYRAEDAQFCSRECYHSWQRKNNLSGEKNPAYQGGKTAFSCEWCESTFYAYEKSNQPNRFCSQECHGAWQTEHKSGANHPLWKGGRRGYGENWNQQRRYAREKADYTCQVCDLTENELGKELDVHHIQPIRTFDTPEEANRLSNLIPLCESCHRQWEGIPLRPQRGE